MPLGVPPTRAIDDAAFSAFLQRSQHDLRAFARRLCGDAADADDVVQETLAKVWRLRASFDPAQDGRAWLRRSALRAFCDHRQRARRAPAPGADVHAAVAPERPPACELREEVERRLHALTDTERALLLGFHRDGLSLRELAARHGIPTNTVKSHLHRARRRLQERTP